MMGTTPDDNPGVPPFSTACLCRLKTLLLHKIDAHTMLLSCTAQLVSPAEVLYMSCSQLSMAWLVESALAVQERDCWRCHVNDALAVMLALE